MIISDELIRDIWNKAVIDDKYPSDVVRKDACGAFIMFDRFGDRNSLFGWEIDHIFPASELKEMKVSLDLIDDERNLRPLNWRNNVSKGDNYPYYTAVLVAADDDSTNVEAESGKVVNEHVQNILKELYNLHD